MAKIIATSIGAALIILGLIGAVTAAPLGAHASPLADLINILSGAAVVYMAQRGGPSGLLWSSLGMGLLYLAWGLIGFILGHPGESTLRGFEPDLNLLVLIPGVLESGRPDHVIHLIIGIGLGTASVASVAETPLRLRR